MKKIAFIPNYFYLNIPTFEIIIKQLLKEKNLILYTLYIAPNTNILKEEKKFYSSVLKKWGVSFIEVPVISFSCSKNYIFSKFKLLRIAFNNWKIVRTWLKKINPDVVVVGSDLGSLNIRFLMDACYLFNIPVVILYNCDVPESTKKSTFSLFYHWKSKYIFKSKILSFFRAVFFNGEVPGEYALNSKVCVISEEVRQRLIKKGVHKDRIIITGILSSSDFLFKPLSEDIFKKLNISPRYKLIILFTECIQYIYGNKYAQELYFNLAQMIKNFPDDIFFLIKLHPLEDKRMRYFLKKVFEGISKCKIVENFTPEELIKFSTLCIAHFSRVLIIAALMNKRFLSINLMRDKERTFIINKKEKILEVNSYEDLRKKILRIMNDFNFMREVDEAIYFIAHRFRFPQSYEKIIELILSLASKQT